MSENIRKFIIITFITIILVIVLELLARAILYSPSAILFSRGNGPGELVPQNRNVDIWEERTYRIIVNSAGFRNVEEFTKDSDYIDVLAIGDSFTFGPYVANMDTWPAQLENELQVAGISARVWNAGRAGSTLIDHLKYIKDRGLVIDPDLVILQYFTNDVPDYRNCTPGARRRDIESLRPTTIINNTALMQLWLRIQTPINSDTGEANAQLEDSGICQYDTIDLLYGDHRDLLDTYLESYRDDLIETLTYLQEANVPIIFVAIPDHYQVYHNYPDEQQQFLQSIFNEVGYGQFVDLLPAFKDNGDIEALYLLNYTDNNSDTPFVGNGHLSRYGYLMVARSILPNVINVIEESALLP